MDNKTERPASQEVEMLKTILPKKRKNGEKPETGKQGGNTNGKPAKHKFAPAFLAIALLAGLLPAMSAWADIIYVCERATGNYDGSSWYSAFTKLQDALAVAVAGDEIWVAAGVYYPVTPDDPDNVTEAEREASFELVDGVAIYGGFSTNCLPNHDWQLHTTVLSGDINTSGDLDGNSYHVVTGSGTGATTVLDGFRVIAGLADGASSNASGAGLYNDGGSPTLTNLIFSGNQAGRGGGMYNGNGSHPALTNVSFRGNEADNGGGLYNVNSHPTLANVSFTANRAEIGGGMYNSSSGPSLTNVIFNGNYAVDFGGGMYNEDSSDPNLTNVSFGVNRADVDGGGMYNDSSHPALTNAIFWNNLAGFATSTTSASIFNNNSTPAIAWSLVANCNPGGTWNPGCGDDNGNNLADTDPLFAGADTPDPADAPTTAGNLRLRAASPAVDAGDPDTDPALFPGGPEDPVDLAGNARIFGAGIDPGAYEHVSADCPDDGIRYVDSTATGSGDGESWAGAYPELRDALEVGEPCEIRVAAGLYYPEFDGSSATFLLENGVRIYGGFPAGGGAWEERDWQTHVTVLSCDINQNDTTDADGVVTDPDDINGGNCLHTVTGSGTDASAVLDGFVITAGSGHGSLYPGSYGGGMLNIFGSPTVSNVRFRGNRAVIAGAGMYNNYSNPSLTNVSFSDNLGQLGGGMYNDNNSHPALTNVSFSRNESYSEGGGMLNMNSNPTLINVSFSGNWSRSDSPGAGGGMYNDNSSPTLINASFSGNQSPGSGGGMLNINNSNPALTNVSFSGNQASAHGGGMFNHYSSPTLTNVIFWNNEALGVTNTTNASIINLASTTTIAWSLVANCNPGGTWNPDCGDDNGNNLADTDPLFAVTPDLADAPTTAGDLRLQDGSPAVDSGDPGTDPALFAGGPGDPTDLGGGPRFVGGAIDLGPHELRFELSFDPAAVDFAEIIIGQAATPQVVLLTNSGTADITGLDFDLSGTAFAADTADCGDSLATDGDCEIIVTFTPDAPGMFDEALDVGSNEDASATLLLSGKSVTGPGILNLAPGELGFGSVAVGATHGATATVANLAEAGAASLELTDINLGGASEFTVTGGGCTIGTVLAPESDCTVEVSFAPETVDGFTGELNVQTGDGQQGQTTLSGQGMTPVDEVFKDRFEPNN